MRGLIAEIERAAFTAWPARETVAYDGWQLRYSDGFSRRINSVAATGPSTKPLVEKLIHCRGWYAQRDLPLLFRLTPLVEEGIDKALDAWGFKLEGETIVMTRPSVPPGCPSSSASPSRPASPCCAPLVAPPQLASV